MWLSWFPRRDQGFKGKRASFNTNHFNGFCILSLAVDMGILPENISFERQTYVMSSLKLIPRKASNLFDRDYCWKWSCFAPFLSFQAQKESIPFVTNNLWWTFCKRILMAIDWWWTDYFVQVLKIERLTNWFRRMKIIFSKPFAIVNKLALKGFRTKVSSQFSMFTLSSWRQCSS